MSYDGFTYRKYLYKADKIKSVFPMNVKRGGRDQLIKDALNIPTSFNDVPLDTSSEHQVGITLDENLETTGSNLAIITQKQLLATNL